MPRTGRPKKWTPEELAVQKSIWNKRYYEKMKALKLCPSCKEGEIDKFARCNKCRVSHSKSNKKWWAKRRIQT